MSLRLAPDIEDSDIEEDQLWRGKGTGRRLEVHEDGLGGRNCVMCRRRKKYRNQKVVQYKV